jgi:MFS family permease
MNILLLLKNKNFTYLWLGQIFEHIADGILWMTFIEYIAKSSLGAALGTSALMFWLILPVILFGQLVGVYIDRYSRRKIMIVINFMRIIFASIIGFIMVKKISIILYYLFAFLLSCITQFFIPAKSTIIPDIVKKDELILANSVSTSSTWIVMLLGLAFGGVCVANFGIQNSIIIVNTCYLLSIISIFLINVEEKISRVKHEISNPFKNLVLEVKEGIKLIFESSIVGFVIVRIIILMAVIGMVFIEIITFTNVLTKNEQIIKNILALGYIILSVGFGILLGPVVLGLIKDKFSKIELIRWSFVFLGIFLIGLSFTDNIVIILIFSPFAGIFFSIIMILAETLFQTHVPQRLLGRAFGSMNTLRQISFSLVSIFAGILDKVLGSKFREIAIFSWEQIIFLFSGLFVTIYGLATNRAQRNKK